MGYWRKILSKNPTWKFCPSLTWDCYHAKRTALHPNSGHCYYRQVVKFSFSSLFPSVVPIFFFYNLIISNLRQEKRATTCKKNDFFFSVSRAAVSISSACSVERNFSLKVSSSSVIPFLTNSRPKISLLRRKCQKYCYLVCLSGASLGPI